MKLSHRPDERPRKRRLIEDWRQSWRFLSVQIGIGAGLLSAAIISAAPSLAIDMLTASLGARIVIGLMFGAAVTFLPWLARILKQGNRHGR